MCAIVASVIALDRQRVPLLTQLGWRENVGFPKTVVVGPFEKRPNLFVRAFVPLAHETDVIRPLVEIRLFLLRVEIPDQFKNELSCFFICICICICILYLYGVTCVTGSYRLVPYRYMPL